METLTNCIFLDYGGQVAYHHKAVLLRRVERRKAAKIARERAKILAENNRNRTTVQTDEPL